MGEGVSHTEVGEPVDEHGDGEGGRAWPLGEQLGDDQPGDRSRTHGEEHDVEEGHEDTRYIQPGDSIL